MNRVNDYIEPVATFTAWVNIYSTKYFCNSKVAEMFVQRKILAVRYEMISLLVDGR